MRKTILVISTVLFISTSSYAQESYVAEENFQAAKKEYSPYLSDHFPQNVYFGDTHL